MNYYDEIEKTLINNEINEMIKDYSKNRNNLKTYYNVGKLLNEADTHYEESIFEAYSVKLQQDTGMKYNPETLEKMYKLYLLLEDK